MSAVLVIFVCFLAIQSTFFVEAVGTCQPLIFSTTASRLNSTCADVVDYSYYLPSSMSESAMNALALSKLGDERLSLMATSCQVALKKMICTSIYLKCKPGIDLSVPSTYNFRVYSDFGQLVPMPFQRPCVQMCSNVISSCWGLLSFFGQQPNCTARYDYSQGAIPQLPYLFDQSGDSSVCFLHTNPVQVAGTIEPYIFQTKGACAGITTNTWIGPSHRFSALLAPMLRPYQLQIVTESRLMTTFTSIPAAVPMTSACNYALRKLFCARTFNAPQLHHLGESLSAPVKASLNSRGVNVSALVTYNTYFPSYPHKSLCTDYSTTCAVLIRAIPSFYVNCSSKSSTGVTLFPENNQVVASMSLKVGANTIPLSYSTAPNTLSAAVDKGSPRASAPVTCAPPLSSSNYSYVCFGAVDYSYFVPEGATHASMNTLALAKLNASGLSILPTSCLAALKKLVCTSVYLKCQPNIVIQNTITWNLDIYRDVGVAFPLPFQRPCASLCTDVLEQCRDLATIFQFTPNCQDRFDYSGGRISSPNLPQPFRYDAKNDVRICNVNPIDIFIGAANEAYVGTACAGITTTVWVPPVDSLPDADFSPLMPPFVIQRYIDDQLQSRFDKLPVHMGAECRFSLKKYFCATSYFKPQAVSFRAAFVAANYSDSSATAYLSSIGVVNTSEVLSFSLQLPAFPHSSVCEDYSDQCSEFRTAAAKKSEEQGRALMPQCNRTTAAGLAVFPTTSQVVFQLDNSYGSGVSVQLDLAFLTDFNSYTDVVADEYEPLCPSGFVVPEEPDNPYSRNVPGTGCAFACFGSAAIAPEQWKKVIFYARRGSTTGLLLVLIFLSIWLSHAEKRKQILVIVFAVSSFVTTITFLSIVYSDPQKMFCKSNSVPISASDGVTACSAEAFILTYCSLVNALSWCMLSYDLFSKIVLNDRRSNHIRIYLPIIFLLPLVSVVYLLVAGSYGYTSTGVWCLNMNVPGNGPVNQDINYLFVPLGIIAAVGGSLMLIVVFNIIITVYHSSRLAGESGQSQLVLFAQSMKLLKTPFAFVFLVGSCWVSLLVYRAHVYNTVDTTRDHIAEWTACVFARYDGTLESYASTCAAHPANMYSINAVRWQMICISGQSVFISCIYITSHIFTAFGKSFKALAYGLCLLLHRLVRCFCFRRKRTRRRVAPNTGDGDEAQDLHENELAPDGAHPVLAQIERPPVTPSPELGASGATSLKIKAKGESRRGGQSAALSAFVFNYDDDIDGEEEEENKSQAEAGPGQELASMQDLIEQTIGDDGALFTQSTKKRYTVNGNYEIISGSATAFGSLSERHSKDGNADVEEFRHLED